MLQKERQKLIGQALSEGKTYKDIAKTLRVSFSEISKIAKEIREPSDLDILNMFQEGHASDEKYHPLKVMLQTKISVKRLANLYEDWVRIQVSFAKYNKVEDVVKPLLFPLPREEGDLGVGEEEKSEPISSPKPAVKERKYIYVCEECRKRYSSPYELQSCPDCGQTKSWKKIKEE